MKINDKKEIELDSHDYVKVTKSGYITELQYLQHRNSKQTVKKISKNKYVVLSTGELKESKTGFTRADNKNGLYKSFKRLRYLINSNFFGARNELFITLTYRSNMTDNSRLRKDFDRFMKRFKYKYNNIKYISVIEPQHRGSFHSHLLVKFLDLNNVFIENEIVAKMWGNGFVNVKSTYGIDNIGAYLTAYLTDIEVNVDDDLNNKNVVEKQIDGQSKKFIKGGRLHLYPSGMNYYRHSKNISEPIQFFKEYGQIKKADLGKSTFKKSIIVKNDNFENAIHFEQYNSSQK